MSIAANMMIALRAVQYWPEDMRADMAADIYAWAVRIIGQGC